MDDIKPLPVMVLIRNARRKARITKVELAKNTGISLSYLEKLESGYTIRHKKKYPVTPSDKVLEKLVKVLNISPLELQFVEASAEIIDTLPEYTPKITDNRDLTIQEQQEIINQMRENIEYTRRYLDDWQKKLDNSSRKTR